MITYLLLANLYLAIFYTFYYVILRKQTFFRLNRCFLLASIALAFTLPMIKSSAFSPNGQHLLQEIRQKAERNKVLNTILISQVEITATSSNVQPDSKISWHPKKTIIHLYLAGCIVSLILLLIRIIYTIRTFKHAHHNRAFSFFQSVCIGRDLEQHEEIIRHESVHVKEWHSLDIVIIQLLKIFNWFNPFIYAVERSIKLQHEYYADKKASGVDQTNYAKLLLSAALDTSSQSLINSFNNPSFLKSRIIMLLENKTPRLKLVKLFLIVPVLIGMIIFSSACQSDSQKNQQNESLPSHTAVPVDSLASQNDHSETKNYFPYAEIEIPPVPHNDEYNSIDEFRQWISHNFIIPSEALAANATGLMEASFIIDEKGEIVNVEIIKDIGYGTGEILKSLLEESSLRWKPGINNGIPVATKYTLPVQIYTTP